MVVHGTFEVAEVPGTRGGKAGEGDKVIEARGVPSDSNCEGTTRAE